MATCKASASITASRRPRRRRDANAITTVSDTNFVFENTTK